MITCAPSTCTYISTCFIDIPLVKVKPMIKLSISVRGGPNSTLWEVWLIGDCVVLQSTTSPSVYFFLSFWNSCWSPYFLLSLFLPFLVYFSSLDFFLMPCEIVPQPNLLFTGSNLFVAILFFVSLNSLIKLLYFSYLLFLFDLLKNCYIHVNILFVPLWLYILYLFQFLKSVYPI